MGRAIRSTIYDVAEKSGVSIATVSRYLNTPDRVNLETAQRIKAVMDDLDYIPHGNAGAVSKRLIGRIGVLAPFFPSASFIQRLQGINQALKNYQYEMIVYTVDTPEQLEEYLSSIPFTKRLDGLIIMSMAIREEQAQKLLDTHLQVVMIENHHPLFSCVEADNIRGGHLAGRYFLEKWYSPCAFIGDALVQPYSLRPSQLRLTGYSSALKLGGHPLEEQYIRLGDLTVEGGRKMALELFELPRRPRAIFAMSDLQAFGVIKAAREKGLRVPEDIAVLGFDDIESADYMELSTITQSLIESGRLAAEILLGKIKEPERPLQVVQLKVSVIERKTT